MSRRFSRARTVLQGREVALSYAGVVTVVALALQTASPSRRASLVLSVSTDPDRLLQHPVRSLLLSPFVVPTLAGLWQLPGVVLAVGAVQRSFGSRLAVLSGVIGHAAVSVAVAVLLERDDDAPATAAAADVGVSYVLAVAAGTALAKAPAHWAAAGAVAGTLITSALLAIGRTSTDVGHLLAWALGLLTAWWLRTPRDGGGP